MKAIVFGASGFIGGHVVEQLQAAGLEVTAAVRETSDTTFLESLARLGRFGVKVVRVDFADAAAIGEAIRGHDVVYNCTADAKLHTEIRLDAPVVVQLARTLVQEAARKGASRFVQLSTIVVYDFKSDEPMDESYVIQPEYPIQRLGLEREKVVREAGLNCGIETIIVRPASTIGVRDRASFFARLFAAHANDQYPMIGDGAAQVSLIDTGDIGRAMAWLGTFDRPEDDDGLYVLKGYDTTWKQLKAEIDRATGKVAKTIDVPVTLTAEQLATYRLNEFACKTFTVNRLWNDTKIRELGWFPRYSITTSVKAAVDDIRRREL
jgi:dihydroflavonol-4-reductase